MLKQISKSIISIVIGSMIVINSSVNSYGLEIHSSHREMPGNTDVERIVDLWDYKNGLTNSDEQMLRQYAKYKKIKKAGKDARNEYRKEYEGTKFDETIIESQHLIDLNDYAREIFPTFDRMSEERQKVIEFVILYYFNKEAKFKNHATVCIDSRGVRYNRGHNEFIDDKLMAMYVGEDICPCQLKHKGPIPKLTIAGAKAAVKRSYQSYSDNYKEVKILSATENKDYITIELEYWTGSGLHYRKLKINKNTRIIESELNSDGEELVY